ncbi:MAG: cache domain-containing protein, partial [Ignavibacteriales bacterium]
FAYLLNETLSTLHGIPQDADIEKRQIAQDILSSHKDLFEILFFMPNGDAYIHEPYSRQQALSRTNFAFREYFQGAIRTNDTYLGNVVNSTAFGTRIAMIAVPVYSLKDNSTLAGVWAGGLDFDTLNEELQSLNLTAGERVVYVDSNGSKIADSDANNTNPQESFANLTSFKNAIMNGQSGSTIETIGDAKMIVTYQPVNVFNNTWAVLFMEQQPSTLPSNQTISSE